MSFDLQPTLQGSLLRLEPLLEQDLEALYLVCADPLIWEQHPTPDRYKRPNFEKFFLDSMLSKGALKIIEAKTGKIIGSSRYYDLNAKEDSVAIGYTFLARQYWGGVYNRELKKLMLDHVFQTFRRAIFHVAEANTRSRKAMTKIGGKVISTMERTPPGFTKPIPYLVFAIDREGYSL